MITLNDDDYNKRDRIKKPQMYLHKKLGKADA
jgi:hypothetical protein